MKIFFWLIVLGSLSVMSCESNNYADSVIEMNTTPCFGACPVYDITIKGDGTVLYDGKQYAHREGKHTKQLTKVETKDLFDAFVAANFFEFEDKYTSNISDLSTTYISFTHDGQTKKIEDYYGAPDALDNLENKIIALAKSDGWEK